MNENSTGQTPNMIAQKMMGDLFASAASAVTAANAAYAADTTNSTSAINSSRLNGIATGVIPTQDPGPSVNQMPVAAPPQETPPPVQEPPAAPVEQPLSEEDKRAHAFANLRYENKQLTGRINEIQKTLSAEQAAREEAARKAAEYEAQLEQERRARAEVEDALGRANLADSKEFKDRFDSRRDTTVQKLASVITEKTDMTDTARAEDFAQKLLSASDSDVLHAIEKLPSYVQGSIYNLVREGKQIAAEREEALTQWRATQTGLSEAEARRRAAELNQRRQELADRAVSAITANTTIPSFTVTDPEFADIRQRRLKEAAAFILTATEEDLTGAAMEGMMAPLSYAMIDSLAEENQHLRQQLDAMYRTSAPPLRATPSSPAPAPRPEPNPQQVSTLHETARGMIGKLFTM